jgi:hypothetical protein
MQLVNFKNTEMTLPFYPVTEPPKYRAPSPPHYKMDLDENDNNNNNKQESPNKKAKTENPKQKIIETTWRKLHEKMNKWYSATFNNLKINWEAHFNATLPGNDKKSILENIQKDVNMMRKFLLLAHHKNFFTRSDVESILIDKSEFKTTFKLLEYPNLDGYILLKKYAKIWNEINRENDDLIKFQNCESITEIRNQVEWDIGLLEEFEPWLEMMFAVNKD